MAYGPGYRESNAQRILTVRFEVERLYQNSLATTTLERSIYLENSDLFGHFLNIGHIEEISYSPAFFENDKLMWMDKNQKPHESAEVVSDALKIFGGYAKEVLNGRANRISWHT